MIGCKIDVGLKPSLLISPIATPPAVIVVELVGMWNRLCFSSVVTDGFSPADAEGFQTAFLFVLQETACRLTSKRISAADGYVLIRYMGRKIQPFKSKKAKPMNYQPFYRTVLVTNTKRPTNGCLYNACTSVVVRALLYSLSWSIPALPRLDPAIGRSLPIPTMFVPLPPTAKPNTYRRQLVNGPCRLN